MITVKKQKKAKKKVNDPYYLLRYDYMIGDADGETQEEMEVSLKNPFVERYYKLLNSLKPIKGHWGVVLEEDRIEDAFNEKQITEDDYNFLTKLMFDSPDSKFEISKENENYAMEFMDGVRSNTEYSFLVFQGVELLYVDEYGKENETIIK